MLNFLIVCPLVFIAGFIDAIAGGGGLISLPAYLLAGIPVHEAIATNKMSACMGTTVATTKYALNGFVHWKRVWPSVIFALLGSSLGANLALTISDDIFTYIMIAILPFVAFYVLKTKNFVNDNPPFSNAKTIVLCCIPAFFIGIYDGFYGPGTGTFLMLLLTGIARVSLNEAAGTTKVINLTTNISSLVVFIMNGKVLFLLGIVSGLFNMAGNYLGATFFSKKGTKIVKPIVITVLAVFLTKLIVELVIGE